MSETAITSSKRKREVSQVDYGTKCLCCNPKCDEAHKKLKDFKPDRYAYFDVPSQPKPESGLSRRPTKADKVKRARKSLKRQRFLKALGTDATTRASDPRYSKTSNKKFGSLHLHDEIYNLCERDKNNKIVLVDSIPSTLANRLTTEYDLKFTATDKFEDDSTFVPLPNVKPRDIVSYANDLESKAERSAKTSPPTSRTQTRGSPITAESMQVEGLEKQVAMQATQLEVQRSELAKREKKLKAEREALETLRQETSRRQQYVAEKLNLILLENEAHGLTRRGILSKEWHRENGNAARHLFGFKSWKDLVYETHAFFDVLPPLEPHKITKATPISPFEQYLMGFMRIHLGMTVESISLIWGRDGSHAGRLINKAVISIGVAGKNLSILHLTPEYLEAACPQQYKDEGLDRCCAVPDGKDFIIFTTRKNTMFTRACFSDKVHASAVRCISWSTPHGLSFEHTDLFLGRVSEKKLVELWGPRLKKCPRGWYMLSDRGFFDTARFYPNMNHQKTPKFLSGRDQFTTDEVSADRKICKLRYTCEVAFSRVTKTRGLRDVISNDFFPLLDAMNDWGHACVNLDRPLMPL